MTAPLQDEFAVRIELDHARIVGGTEIMTVRDKNIAVGRDQNRVGFVECVMTGAGDAGLAQDAQHFAVVVELQHVIAEAVPDMTVRHPDVIVLVDGHAVGEKEFSCAERFDEIPMRVEFHHRIELGAVAIIGAAAIHHPDMPLMIHRHRIGRTHGAAGRHFEEIADGKVGIGLRVGRIAGPCQANTAKKKKRNQKRAAQRHVYHSQFVQPSIGRSPQGPFCVIARGKKISTASVSARNHAGHCKCLPACQSHGTNGNARCP